MVASAATAIRHSSGTRSRSHPSTAVRAPALTSTFVRSGPLRSVRNRSIQPESPIGLSSTETSIEALLCTNSESCRERFPSSSVDALLTWHGNGTGEGTRHVGDFDHDRTREELWNEEVAETVAGPWPQLEIDTDDPVDLGAVVHFLRSHLRPQ